MEGREVGDATGDAAGEAEAREGELNHTAAVGAENAAPGARGGGGGRVPRGERRGGVADGQPESSESVNLRLQATCQVAQRWRGSGSVQQVEREEEEEEAMCLW